LPPAGGGTEKFMGTVITVAMTKGGVGKTTTAVNIAAAFAMNGYSVCLIDLDQQGNATYSVTGQPKYNFNDVGLFDLLMSFGMANRRVGNYLHETRIPNLKVVPATGMTNQILPLLAILKARHPDVKEYQVLDACIAPLREMFEIVLIDTPPAKDALTVSGIYAADQVLMPVNADKYSLDALMETCSLIQSINREDGRDVDVLGVVLTKVERNSATALIRKRLHTQELAPLMLQSEIRKGAAVTDSTLQGGPVLLTEPRSNPSKDYLALYEEIRGEVLET
jgi:chromosome partitioning protein